MILFFFHPVSASGRSTHLRWSLRRRVSRFLVATRVSSPWVVTRAAPNTSSGSAKASLPTPRLRRGWLGSEVSSSRPRNSAVPRPRPVQGFKITGSSCRCRHARQSGRRRDRRPSYGAARGAGSGRANLLLHRFSTRSHGPGANQNVGVGHNDAWRFPGSACDRLRSDAGPQR